MVNRIAREELLAKIERGDRFVLAEALPAAYFEDAHLPGAVNLPHDAVAELAPSLLGDTSAEVVVYCANAACKNSHLAANRLAALGYANVRVYAEGKEDWLAAGLPTEGSAVRAG